MQFEYLQQLKYLSHQYLFLMLFLFHIQLVFRIFFEIFEIYSDFTNIILQKILFDF